MAGQSSNLTLSPVNSKDDDISSIRFLNSEFFSILPALWQQASGNSIRTGRGMVSTPFIKRCLKGHATKYGKVKLED